jgi:hypothetical protein
MRRRIRVREQPDHHLELGRLAHVLLAAARAAATQEATTPAEPEEVRRDA